MVEVNTAKEIGVSGFLGASVGMLGTMAIVVSDHYLGTPLTCVTAFSVGYVANHFRSVCSDNPNFKPKTYIASVIVGGLATAATIFNSPAVDQTNSCKNAQIEYKADNVAEITPPQNCKFIIK